MMHNKTESTISFFAYLTMAWISGVSAFVVTTHCRGGISRAPLPSMMTRAVIPPLVGGEAFNAVSHQPSILISDAMDALKNIAIAIGGIIAVLAAFAILFSTFIIPAAADQIEKQAKELDPTMWKEYEQRLEPGETLAMRPDLMQELGNKVQAQALAELEKMEAQMKERESSSKLDVIDVDVVREGKGKED